MTRPSPQQISRELARIAMAIETSDKPSLSSVHGQLRRVAASVSRETRVRRIASELIRLAAEDLEVSLWDMDEANDVKSAWKAAQGVTEDPSKLAIALKSLKGDVDTYIDELTRSPGDLRQEEGDEDVFTSAPKRGDVGKKPEHRGPPGPPERKGPPGPPPKR